MSFFNNYLNEQIGILNHIQHTKRSRFHLFHSGLHAVCYQSGTKHRTTTALTWVNIDLVFCSFPLVHVTSTHRLTEWCGQRHSATWDTDAQINRFLIISPTDHTHLKKRKKTHIDYKPLTVNKHSLQNIKQSNTKYKNRHFQCLRDLT